MRYMVIPNDPERDTDAVNLTDAKARLSELVDWVEAGASIDNPPRGKPVARLTTVSQPRKPIDLRCCNR